MTIDSCTKKDFLITNRATFGILENVSNEEYINIETKHVRAVATRQIRENIPLPSVNGILNNCRGIISYPGEIDTSYASFRVTNAREELVHCETNRPGVRVIIEGQIVIRSVQPNPNCAPTYIAIPVQVVDEELFSFCSTKDGSPITNLKNELAYIDGSCMTVQLTCNIYKDTSYSCPRYMARIRGNIVDKLWKRENVWVEGIRPYPANSLTFCDTFEPECLIAVFDDTDSENC